MERYFSFYFPLFYLFPKKRNIYIYIYIYSIHHSLSIKRMQKLDKQANICMYIHIYKKDISDFGLKNTFELLNFHMHPL